jgi:hypothetical protein
VNIHEHCQSVFTTIQMPYGLMPRAWVSKKKDLERHRRQLHPQSWGRSILVPAWEVQVLRFSVKEAKAF